MENLELFYNSLFTNQSMLLLDLEAAVLSIEEKQLAMLKSVLSESSEFLTSFLVNYKHIGFSCFCVLFLLVVLTITVKCCQNRKSSLQKAQSQEADINIFDLVKTAYETGHTEESIRLIEKLNYDVNDRLPSSGLTLFLCACLSGKKELIYYMLTKGANLTTTTRDGDSVLYLATFGVLNSKHPDMSVLEMLISAGCEINRANNKGFTPLHQAASKGNVEIIKYLLSKGANPYNCNKAGTYPIDSAVNAGHLKVAELLKIDVANPHVWEVVEPHTPTRIQLGLQSPHCRLLMESSRRQTFRHILT
ncbi:protein VAPYRIN-like [Gigantopelta aegis]|uniref:protein VAPYRIN-like n=1 Tax=Gigantopelta aegis TaxID=1735272 RepID=UPI001B887827|nr:protein VAPYRIN-like [Gigantopelta aegis]XP_041367615.1 protein VAPYRIN-like [Gigantopelta aegis]